MSETALYCADISADLNAKISYSKYRHAKDESTTDTLETEPRSKATDY